MITRVEYQYKNQWLTLEEIKTQIIQEYGNATDIDAYLIEHAKIANVRFVLKKEV